MKKGTFKKYVCLFFTVIMFLVLSIPATAKSSISFNEKIQTKNNIISYKIEVSSDSNICALSFEIKYSESQVKVNNCTVGKILDGGIAKCNSTIGGKVIFTYISTSPLKDNDSIILVEFEALSSDNKNINVDCEITECIDKDCNEIAYTFSKNPISNPNYVAINKEDEDKNASTASSSGSQKDSSAEEKPNNPSENVTDELTSDSGGDSNSSASSSKSESAILNTEKNESDGGDTKDTDKEAYQGKTNDIIKWLIALVCLVIVPPVVYLTIVKPILLKRRIRNEKK